MKRFRLSLIFMALLLATVPFHLEMERALVNLTGKSFITYAIYAFFTAFFAISALRAFSSGRITDISALTMAAGSIFYLLYRTRFLYHRLHLMQFFLLGYLLMRGNNRKKSAWPFLLLVLAAFFFEFIQKFIPGRVFDTHDIWLNLLAGLAGFIAALV